METACYLAGLGSSVTVVVRSQVLRSFDQQVVRQLEEQLQREENLEILKSAKPIGLTKLKNGQIDVSLEVDGKQSLLLGVDCVVLAVGRAFDADASGLGALKDVKLHPQR